MKKKLFDVEFLTYKQTNKKMIESYKIRFLDSTPYVVQVHFKFTDGFELNFVCGLQKEYDGIFRLMAYMFKDAFPFTSIPEGTIESLKENHVQLVTDYVDPDLFETELDYQECLQNHISDYSHPIMSYNIETSTLSIITTVKVHRRIDGYPRIEMRGDEKKYVLTQKQKRNFVRILQKINMKCDLYNQQLVAMKKIREELSLYLFDPTRLERLADKQNMLLFDFIGHYRESLLL